MTSSRRSQNLQKKSPSNWGLFFGTDINVGTRLLKLYTVLTEGFLRTFEELAISLGLYSLQGCFEFCYTLSVSLLTVRELPGCLQVSEFLLSLFEFFSDHLHRWGVL